MFTEEAKKEYDTLTIKEEAIKKDLKEIQDKKKALADYLNLKKKKRGQ